MHVTTKRYVEIYWSSTYHIAPVSVSETPVSICPKLKDSTYQDEGQSLLKDSRGFEASPDQVQVFLLF
jgi:hypothetical protein